MRRTVFDGMANPTPDAVRELLRIAVLTPITRPSASSKGPPLFPGLMAASVWISSGMLNLSSFCKLRSNALTMPAVSVNCWPNGLPIAYTRWPTNTSSESANVTGARATPDGSTRMTARSASGSRPTSSAATIVPSMNVTRIYCASSTTWLLVTMWPSVSITKPVPVPALNRDVTLMLTTDCVTFAYSSARCNSSPCG